MNGLGMIILSPDEGYAPAVSPVTLPVQPVTTQSSLSWLMPVAAALSILYMLKKR